MQERHLSPILIDMQFVSEENVWHTEHYDLLARSVTIPGLSPVYPQIHCDVNGTMCQATMGESGTQTSTSHKGRYSEANHTTPTRNQRSKHHVRPRPLPPLQPHLNLLHRLRHRWHKPRLRHARLRRHRPLRRASRARIPNRALGQPDHRPRLARRLHPSWLQRHPTPIPSTSTAPRCLS